MVIAYHLIFTAYGFWLPNDPRGSWSDFVRSFDLFLAAGPATKVATHRSVANAPHDRNARIAAKDSIHHAPVVFDDAQIAAIGDGLTAAVERSHFVLHACSVLPTHVHAVVRRHKYKIETVMNQLKGQASTALVRAEIHPFQNTILPAGTRHSPWAEEGWDVYLNDEADIRRSIAYVENNPMREGRWPQRWSFVTDYDTEI